jgi:hypothetical protein
MARYREADRRRFLDLNPETLRNQVDAVKEEGRVNVLNQPYGGFSWLWLAQYDFKTCANSRNYYGEFADLAAARQPSLARSAERDTMTKSLNCCGDRIPEPLQ